MRAVLTNFGTTGDIQPFLALATEMCRHGHQPLLAFSPDYESRVQNLGLHFFSLGPDLQEARRQVNIQWMDAPESYESTEQMHRLLAPLMSASPQVYEQLRGLCAQTDVLISGPAQPAARMVHETQGTPFVSIQFSHFGGTGLPALQQASAALINPFRTKLGLPSLSNPLTIDANSPQLALYAMSRHIRPLQASRPAHYRVTGFFFLDDKNWQPETELVNFLSSGQSPVVITFGSMSQTREDPNALKNIILEACEIAECRAIVQQAGDRQINQYLAERVYTVGYVPHGWLFSRAACIVHHGGGGTVGAVLRSGVPSVFVPHGKIFDQHYWAQLAQEAGCAGPAVPYAELTAERLGAAIKHTLSRRSYSEAASALGEKVRAEQGVRNARCLIEELVRKVGLRGNAEDTDQYHIDSAASREEKTARRKRYFERQRSKGG
jgi:sterol 3beta-glucosyltransferase